MTRRSIANLLLIALCGAPWQAGATTQDPGAAAERVAVPPIGPIGNRIVRLSPRVDRPSASACVVTLFDRREFRGDTPLALAYRPPAGCRGKWSKIVLEADFDVSTGTQFDRTADLTLGGVTLFVGTTMEPGKDYAPRWRVEQDVTRYADLFRRPAPGVASLANFLDGDHDGRLFWSARLIFYPAGPSDGHVSPPRVLPVTGGMRRLDAAAPALSQTLRFPRNMTGVMLDVFAVGQAREEFWFDCKADVPGKQILPWQARCLGPYRDVEVRIDDVPAGVRSIGPIIFTGGITPALWRRVPALDAMNIPVGRIDLTPFAGRLNDGRPHVVTLAIPGVGEYFRIGATLLVTLDPGRTIVPGGVTRVDLKPARVVTTASGAPRVGNGRTVETRASRTGAVTGYLETSRGRVETQVTYDAAATVTDVDRPRQAIKLLDLRQTAVVKTIARATTSVRRSDEQDRMTVDFNVSPPRYGVEFGNEVTLASDRTETIDGATTGVRRTLTSFAPASSPFLAVRETPNHVRQARAESDGGGCRIIDVAVTDDQVTNATRSLRPNTAAPCVARAPDGLVATAAAGAGAGDAGSGPR